MKITTHMETEACIFCNSLGGSATLDALLPQPKSPSPLPLSPTKLALPKRGEGENPGGCVTQGSSFLATAGLICETRFGVFQDGAEKVEGAMKIFEFRFWIFDLWKQKKEFYD
jgi:hypothetical protein